MQSLHHCGRCKGHETHTRLPQTPNTQGLLLLLLLVVVLPLRLVVVVLLLLLRAP